MVETHVRIGGSGLGELGMETLAAFDERPDVTVVAGFDPVNAEARETFESLFDAGAAYDDLDEMLAHEDLDGISIVSPHTVHYEQAKKSVEAGTPAYVEKPMVTDIDHAIELHQLAEDGALIQLGCQRHLDPTYQNIREAVQSGDIGDIIHAEGKVWQPGWEAAFDETWRANPALSGGGELYDTGQHLIDAMLWATNTVPTAVEAEMDYLADGADVNSELSVTLQRRDEPCSFSADIGVYGNIPRDGQSPNTICPEEYLHLHGTEGDIVLDDGTLSISDGYGEKTVDVDPASHEAVNPQKISAFVDGIHGYETDAATTEDGLYATLLTEAAYEAAERGEPISAQQPLSSPQIQKAYADD